MKLFLCETCWATKVAKNKVTDWKCARCNAKMIEVCTVTGPHSVKLNLIVSLIDNKIEEHSKIKQEALDNSDVQCYQFEAGYIKALVEIAEQIGN